MEDFLIYTFKSAGFITLFYLCYRIFLHRETFFKLNRYFLLTGMALSVMLPFLTITRMVEGAPVNYIPAGPTGNPDVRDITAMPDIWSVIFWIYISGAAFFAGRLLLQLWSLKRFLSGCEKDRQEGFVLAETTRNTMPFSFFNLIVYNPSMYTDKKELNAILEHEKVHAWQKHSLDMILLQLFMVFQWCNPVVWLYKRMVSANLEYLADRDAVRKGINKKDYQYLLLGQTEAYKNYIALTNTFFNSSIKKRVVMLNKNNSSRKQLWKYGVVIPVLTVFLLIVNTKIEAQEKKTPWKVSAVEETITVTDTVHVSKDGKLPIIVDGKFAGEDFDINSIKGRLMRVIENKKVAVEKYGAKGKNGVIEIFTEEYLKKNPEMEYMKSEEQYPVKYDKIKSSSGDDVVTDIKTSSPWKVKVGVQSVDGKQPRIAVNGKLMKKGFDINTLDLSRTEKTTLFKDKEAIEKYGEDGADGVVEITIKEE
ncbi:M56 family metallopeptidase [Sinomicrobium weinanense]|uniref:M56 family metallopeptidase n=1 Tax=Sinomicrobium weinanense TaxID=2842200 RepID=A0A926JUF4_9FLAO|nr:M56 family metallopeptidase [Sinomicrobium weinanense]MBC9797743.1 M56 family metallopeptidase [Sinomicrobium weinanense]MBU3123634.1 M56 family metallopeptidase [Sinomicrobium weinanense]